MGQGYRGLTDIRVGGVQVVRYMCKGCGGCGPWARTPPSWLEVKGKKVITSIVADVLSGKTVSIDFLDQEDAESLKKCIQKAAGKDLKLLVSDDADAYKVVAEDLGLKHQLCTCHAKKAHMRRAQSIAASTAADNPYHRQIVRGSSWLQRAMRRGKKLTIGLWRWSPSKGCRPTLRPALRARAKGQAPGTACG